jgi:aspartokinase
MESRASVAELATSDATTARVVVVVSPLTIGDAFISLCENQSNGSTALPLFVTRMAIISIGWWTNKQTLECDR